MIMKHFAPLERDASCIVMGSVGFGTSLTENMVFDVLDQYAAMGGNVIDAARVYEAGESEKIIGRWLAARGCRDRFIVNSKGGHPLLSDMRKSRLDPQSLYGDIQDTLSALGIACVDVYFLHRDDIRRPVGEIMETLNHFLEKGWCKALGASNWMPERILEANRYAKVHKLTGFSVNQPQWSLARQLVVEDATLYQMNPDMYRMHEQTGMICMPFSSQAKGFFIKLAQGGEAALTDKARRRYYGPHNMAIFDALTEISRATGLSVGALQLAFLTGQPFGVLPIVGVSRPEQMDALREAADARLTPENLKTLMDLAGLII